MDEDGKPLTVRRALRAAEFWLLLVAAIAAVFRVPWWVTVPLVMGGFIDLVLAEVRGAMAASAGGWR